MGKSVEQPLDPMAHMVLIPPRAPTPARTAEILPRDLDQRLVSRRLEGPRLIGQELDEERDRWSIAQLAEGESGLARAVRIRVQDLGAEPREQLGIGAPRLVAETSERL